MGRVEMRQVEMRQSEIPKRTRVLRCIAKVLFVASIVFLVASLVLRVALDGEIGDLLGLLFQTVEIASLLSGFGLRARSDPIYDIKGRVRAQQEAEHIATASMNQAENHP
jgi:hypothetical protein